MSEFIAGFVPILVMWLVPIAPMLYAGIVASVEALIKPVQGEAGRRVSTNAGTAVLKARAELRQLADQSTGDQQAA